MKVPARSSLECWQGGANAAAMPEDATRSLTGRGVYPPKFAWLLTLPLRRLIISPEALADRLHLTETAVVLEVGSGPGWTFRPVTRRT